ncbi:diguanylate cyclase [Pseudomonas sp. sp1636]|uniref:diguanylate cyclase domain-containing protein n=1 Tax=Pseudomonas sp. sp1636 TaxID=3036707 RepID=UPI0025A5FD73|nr:diguanylate cyclase [Pseudomonas sp. sp1636]MDM8349221.1 diguanylate cyclase [Pseudomonas sp. sp1636]
MLATSLAIIAALLIVFSALVLLCLRRVKQQLAQHRALLDALPEGLLLVGHDGRVSVHNAAAARMLGNPAATLQGTPLQRWWPQPGEHTTALTRQRILLSVDGQQQAVGVSRVAAATHGHALVLVQLTSLHDNPVEDAERFKRSQYFASIGTWDWSIDTDKLYWSEAIYAMFGFKAGEVTPSYELFCTCVHPDDLERVRAGELRCIETGHNHDEEYRVIWPDGSIHWLRETGNVVKDACGQPVKMMGIVRDISEEKASVNQLKKIARHDPLTGLPNRLLLEEFLTHALARARSNATRVALVFIDLNGFKQVNDKHGHAVGDRLLVSTAQRLQQALRESDMVARLGGDEFVVIIEGLALGESLHDEAQLISEKILQRLSQPIDLGNASHRVGASLGIAMFPEHGPNIDSLIHIADQAMYAAKRNGNNQYCLGMANAGEPSPACPAP